MRNLPVGLAGGGFGVVVCGLALVVEQLRMHPWVIWAALGVGVGLVALVIWQSLRRRQAETALVPVARVIEAMDPNSDPDGPKVQIEAAAKAAGVLPTVKAAIRRVKAAAGIGEAKP